MKFTVLIPTSDNNGRRFRRSKLRAICDRFGFVFGGCSVEGPIQGMWTEADGTLYRDELLKVTVVTSAERLDEARRLVIEIGRDLGSAHQ